MCNRRVTTIVISEARMLLLFRYVTQYLHIALTGHDESADAVTAVLTNASGLKKKKNS